MWASCIKPAKLPEKVCAPRAKAALNANDGHTKCWFILVNRSELINKIYLIHYFWQDSIFKCLTLLTVLDLQGGFLKHLGDVASVLINLVLSQFLHVIPDRLMMIRSHLRGALAVVRHLVQTKISLAKWMFGNVQGFFCNFFYSIYIKLHSN